MAFARFMSGPIGRWARIIAGAAILVGGVLLALSGGGVGAIIGGVVLVLVGALVFYAGAANVCFIAPMIRAPFRGRDARS